MQDIFMHETALLADVVLPATTFAEKDGTFTNSERRVQRVRQAVARWATAGRTGISCATWPDGCATGWIYLGPGNSPFSILVRF